MLSILRKTALAGVCIAAMGGAAAAADFDPVPSDSSAHGGFYIRGDFGIAISDAENQPSTEEAFAVGGGLGYRFNEMFRADVTFDGAFDYEFQVAGVDVDVDVYSVMANVYFDLPVNFVVQPYIGAGIGWAWLEADAGFLSADDDDLALAAMGGFTFDLTATRPSISVTNSDISTRRPTGSSTCSVRASATRSKNQISKADRAEGRRPSALLFARTAGRQDGTR